MLTARRERFCQEIVAGKSQSDAYRVAFNAKGMKASTIHKRSGELMKNGAITGRIAALMAPVIQQVQLTRAQWLKKMESFYHADVRKMFDDFGNPLEIPQLHDHEAIMIEGFEFVEDFTKVKKADGQTDAVPTGYTKKFKLTSKLKAMLEFGKVMGWYTEQPKEQRRPLVVIIQRDGGPSEQQKPVDVTPRTKIEPQGESKHPPLPVRIVRDSDR